MLYIPVETTTEQSIALHKPANQSSTRRGGVALRAVDGNYNTAMKEDSCTWTNKDYSPWWYVDLEQMYHIGSVALTNRAHFGKTTYLW